MADKPSSTSSRGAAVRLRPRRKLLLYAALVLLGFLLVVTVLALVRRAALQARPEATAEPQITAEPAPEQEAPPETAPEPTADPAVSIPPDTSGEQALHNVQRRDGFPLLSWNVNAFHKDADGRMVYTGGVSTQTGIDVSAHQYDIDWKKVAAAGIDFAVIRVGYRGSTAGGLYIDEYFEANMRGAQAAGIPVGVYFYSQAINADEAREEAAFVLEQIKGYQITYPVVFDWEIVGGDSARTYSVSRQTLVECTRAFCEQIREAGYDPMIYFTRYLGYRKYILRNLTDYGFWYAEYEDRPRFAIDFDMWQYSDTGRVDGIDGDVDLNILFLR